MDRVRIGIIVLLVIPRIGQGQIVTEMADIPPTGIQMTRIDTQIQHEDQQTMTDLLVHHPTEVDRRMDWVLHRSQVDLELSDPARISTIPTRHPNRRGTAPLEQNIVD